MIGVDVLLDGEMLPTYWADGLIVSTSSGSTGYSLSVGGPICTPQAKVFVIAPIAPHNLNLRPLVVPQSSDMVLSFHSREGLAVLSTDNTSIPVPQGTKIGVSMAQFSLKRLRPSKSNFICALKSKLLWGEDVRNS